MKRVFGGSRTFPAKELTSSDLYVEKRNESKTHNYSNLGSVDGGQFSLGERADQDEDVITEIRHALNTGLGLGNDQFRREVEPLTGQRQHHLKRGPKPKNKAHQKEEFLL